ncbi:hypothetical protein [Paraburkholderia susongensis]|uniref:Integrase catalytic domain-containing protein n=1 Tax=Paraburkholderia susongensis TaxID=1515439 RepID=A0A1X7KFB1_9BURK|nr:hypothetical protein [Paraburkholderia susongensis]SMG39937.1 hypothetical protein SAMN06265784_103727 [Paraburkholderia susongensis]
MHNFADNTEPKALLQADGDHKNGKYYRFVHRCNRTELTYLLIVYKNGRPGTTLPKPYSPVEVAGMRLVDEEIADPQMTGLTDDKLKAAWKRGREKRWPAVREVILNTERILTDSDFADVVISQVAQKFGVSKNSLKHWVTTYYANGSIENGLLERGWARGKSKTGARKVTKKLGRRNALELDGYTHLGGVNSERFIPLIKQALLLYWIGQNESLPRTYDLMVQTLLVSTTKIKGEVVTKPMRPEKVLTLGQFEYRANQLIKNDPDLMRQKVGELEYIQRYEALAGASSDIALRPGHVLDMDATPFNCELVADWDTSRNIGKPYVLFAVDRGSSAILGFFIWYKGESWEAYRQLVLMALSPKDQLLAKHKFEKDDWPLHGIPGVFFVDNGPGPASEKAKAALVERLGADRMHAPVRQGQAKGQVENHQGIVQRAISTHNGAFKRERPLRERDKRRRARAESDVVHDSFERALLAEVIQFNKYTQLPQYLIDDMRIDDVNPNPEEMYLWAMKNGFADAALSWDTSTTYLKLLDRKRSTVRKGKVELNCQQYCSPASIALYEEWKRSPKKRRGDGPKITTCPLPFRPDNILWEHDDGTFSKLERVRKSQTAYSGTTWKEVERKIRDDSGSAIMVQHRRTRRGLLRQEQAQRVARSAGVKIPSKPASTRAARALTQAKLTAELAERDEQLLPVERPAPATQDERLLNEAESDDAELDALFNAKFLT